VSGVVAASARKEQVLPGPSEPPVVDVADLTILAGKVPERSLLRSVVFDRTATEILSPFTPRTLLVLITEQQPLDAIGVVAFEIS